MDYEHSNIEAGDADGDICGNPVHAAIVSRRSVRAFLPTPIAGKTIRRILSVASRAPSGSNMQPWRVHVVVGTALARLKKSLSEAHASGEATSREYDYYPEQWREPYLGRRRKVGWQLYDAVGVKKGDREATRRQHGRNYVFFDAPVGLIFSIEKELGRGSFIDFGIFLQSLMIAIRGEGLHSCPQAALANYPGLVRAELEIPESELILCGMAVGHADLAAPVNGFLADREPLEAFVTFHEL